MSVYEMRPVFYDCEDKNLCCEMRSDSLQRYILRKLVGVHRGEFQHHANYEIMPMFTSSELDGIISSPIAL